MPYKIEWLREKRIMVETLLGTISMEEATQAANETAQFLNQGEAPVHLIVDVSHMEKFPTNVRNVRNISGYLSNPALGWMVIVGADYLVNFISTIVSQVVRFQLSRAETVEKAVTFLEKQDATLTRSKAAIGPD